jgi:hypothetical protein
MPILGIIDSAKSGNLGGPLAYDSIATYTVSSNTSTITFSSIPQTYKHLQLRIWNRNNRNANVAACSDIMYFNSDNAANYAIHRVIIQGSGSGNVSTDGYGSQPGVWAGDSPGAQFNSNSYSYSVCEIVDYTNTNKYTTTRTHSNNNNNAGGPSNAGNYITGVWYNTNAVSRIDIYPVGASAQQYAAGSVFCLYGIKG